MMYIVKCNNEFYWFILGLATDELCLQDWMTGGWGFHGAMGHATAAPAVHADGAFIVRFANHFLSAFCQEKNFVLCALFIWGNGTATRHTLFQQQIKNDEVACCALCYKHFADSAVVGLLKRKGTFAE